MASLSPAGDCSGVFLLNAFVLLSLTLMIVSMVVAAPNVVHHAH
jgi:hypothetical protein